MDTINLELMLLDWRETARGGAVLVVQLADPADLEPFKAMTLKKGKIAGQRLMAVFVEIDDQERPIAHPAAGKGGQLSILAARWCKDPLFQDWLETLTGERIQDEQAAAECVRTLCAVNSRAELDSDEAAGMRFEAHIRRPYMEQLQAGWPFNP